MRRLSFCTLFSPFVVIALASTLVLAKTEPAATLPVKDAKQGVMRIGLTASLFRDMPDALLQIVMKPFSAVMEQQTGMISAKKNPRAADLLRLIRLSSFESIPDSFYKTLTQLAKDYPLEAADKK